MIEYFIFQLGGSNSEKSVKMRSKQQAHTHVVKSTWNQALSLSRKQGYGEKAVVEHASWRHRKIFTICRRTTASPYHILKSLMTLCYGLVSQ